MSYEDYGYYSDNGKPVLIRVKKQKKQRPEKIEKQKRPDRFDMPDEGKSAGLGALRIIGRITAFIGSIILLLVVFLYLLLLIVIKGPSSEAARLMVLSAYETSAAKWVPSLYLSDEDIDAIRNPVQSENDFVELPTAPDMVSMSGEEIETSEGDVVVPSTKQAIEVIDIKGSTYKGKLMLVRDPSKVKVASIDSFGGAGWTLAQFLEKYNAIGCTNAGGFEDENGKGKGGIPDGIVIRDGQIVYGDAGGSYRGLFGFTSDNRLVVGNMSGQQALSLGIQNGTSFEIGPVLIKDGERQSGFNGGINPRTAIGQAEDGTVILVAIEGRLAESLGATFDNLADLMEEYGAVNAINLDGGSSSGMYYEGERITKSCSLIGDRALPTAIVVLGQ